MAFLDESCTHAVTLDSLASSVLNLLLDAIVKDGGLWPSRIRADHGVEIVLVCGAMVDAGGESRASFIAGPSTHNQRIERHGY